MKLVLDFLIQTAGAAVIGALIGLAVAMLITLPELERFWIGAGMLAAAAVWGLAVVARAWWEGRP